VRLLVSSADGPSRGRGRPGSRPGRTYGMIAATCHDGVTVQSPGPTDRSSRLQRAPGPSLRR
jgi:hypothetical protein